MKYSKNDVLGFVNENDVKFIRLTFSDVFGKLKNVAIMPTELPDAFESGISIDSSAYTGLLNSEHYDLYLIPDPSTLSVLPWRPKSGRVVRFFCDIKHSDGTQFEGDTRNELKKTIDKMSSEGLTCKIGSECQFYLFERDEKGEPTKKTHDKASYLDVAPLDKGENIRREICLTLDEMGITPQSSRHLYGWGQNEITFKNSDVLTAADNLIHFKTVVKTIASQNGLYASFMPKPIKEQVGSGLHINISINKNGKNIFEPDLNSSLSEEGQSFVAGILKRINEITCFLNPLTNSYKRIGKGLSPKFINWSTNRRYTLIRIPNADKNNYRIEVRSPDPACNPYIAFNLLLLAGLEGIKNKEKLPENEPFNQSGRLPKSLEESMKFAVTSDFIGKNLPKFISEALFNSYTYFLSRYEVSENKDDFEREYYFHII